MGWFTKSNKSSHRPRMEMVQDYLPQAKPFTKALMLRASQRGDEAYDDMKKMLGKVSYKEDDFTFEDFVTSCAVSTSLDITRSAAKSINVKSTFMPGFDLPKEASYVVGFSICVLSLIDEYLLGDEVAIDLEGSIIETARLSYQPYYMLNKNKEAAKLALEGIKVYDVIKVGNGKVETALKDGLSKVISNYVLQWTSDKEEFKKFDCTPFFGKYLRILINVGMHGVATDEEMPVKAS
jgi:hypothetical protein